MSKNSRASDRDATDEPVAKRARLRESLWGSEAFADATLVILEEDAFFKPSGSNLDAEGKEGCLAKSINESSEVRISKAMLAQHSEFFRGMFLHDMAEGRSSRAEIKVSVGQRAACVDVIRFVYANKFEETSPTHLLMCLRLADRFQLTHVRAEACALLLRAGNEEMSPGPSSDSSKDMRDEESQKDTEAYPSPDVFESLLCLPDSLTCSDWFAPIRVSIQQALVAKVPSVFAMLCNNASSNWRWRGRTLALWLSSDALRIEREVDTFHIVRSWYRTQPEAVCRDTSPGGPVGSVLRALRFPCMDLRFLVTFVLSCRWDRFDHVHDVPLVEDAIKYQSLGDDQGSEKLQNSSNKKLFVSRNTARALRVSRAEKLVIHSCELSLPASSLQRTDSNDESRFTHMCMTTEALDRGVAIFAYLQWTETPKAAVRVRLYLAAAPENLRLCGHLSFGVTRRMRTLFKHEGCFVSEPGLDDDGDLVLLDKTESNVTLFNPAVESKFAFDEISVGVLITC